MVCFVFLRSAVSAMWMFYLLLMESLNPIIRNVRKTTNYLNFNKLKRR
jgi:hypothetical protein